MPAAPGRVVENTQPIAALGRVGESRWPSWLDPFAKIVAAGVALLVGGGLVLWFVQTLSELKAQVAELKATVAGIEKRLDSGEQQQRDSEGRLSDRINRVEDRITGKAASRKP